VKMGMNLRAPYTAGIRHNTTSTSCKKPTAGIGYSSLEVMAAQAVYYSPHIL